MPIAVAACEHSFEKFCLKRILQHKNNTKLHRFAQIFQFFNLCQFQWQVKSTDSFDHLFFGESSK